MLNVIYSRLGARERPFLFRMDRQRPAPGLLTAVRFLYLGVQALRLETIVLHLEVQRISTTSFAVLILGILLGTGSHVVSIMVLGHARAQVASTTRQSQAPLKQKGTTTTASSLKGAPLPWVQPLVVPLSMAGLVLELLSGVPAVALPHSRTSAIILLLSIALQRNTLWETLPQLAAALALDFTAFLAAAFVGRYNTPYSVVYHLVSTTVAAIAVVLLTPLYNRVAAIKTAKSQQLEEVRTRSLLNNLDDPTALEQPLLDLPTEVIQVLERRLLPVYRRKILYERVASAVLVLASVLRGSTVPYSIVASMSPTFPGGAAAVGVTLSPLLRARVAAASLALLTSSTLLLLNGLLAQLPGHLYEDHSAQINSIVTALHGLGHVAHMLVLAPSQRSRAQLVRMMALMTANLVANEDSWFAFLAQLLLLLGLVMALDMWMSWGAACCGVGDDTLGCRHAELGRALAGVVGTDACGGVGSLGTPALPVLLPWLISSSHQPPGMVEGSCAVDTPNATASDSSSSSTSSMGPFNPLLGVCYALITATGLALCRSFTRGKYLKSYRLYRMFYLPESYGGICVTAPLPYDEVMHLRDGTALVPAATSVSSSSSATIAMIFSPRRQSEDDSNRMRTSRDRGRRAPTRRSVSLNTFMGTGGMGISHDLSTAAGIPIASSGHAHSLRAATSMMSTLSSITSERTTAAATVVATVTADPGVGVSLRSPFSPSRILNGASPVATGGPRVPSPGNDGGAPSASVAERGEALVATAMGMIPSVGAPISETPDEGGSIDAATGYVPDGPRPNLASTLTMDEADVISGKINVTRQLSKLAALGGNGTREVDRLVQSLDTGNGTNSSAHTSGVSGVGYGAHSPPTAASSAVICTTPPSGTAMRNVPPRCSSDLSHLYGNRPTLQGVRLKTPDAASSLGASAVTPSVVASAGGSFLESVAASLASEGFSVAGGFSWGGEHSGHGTPTGGQHQRVHRLRAVPARASSDLAARRYSLNMHPLAHLHPDASPQVPQVLPHPQQPHSLVPQHRPPRRSPSDVSYLEPSYHHNAKSLAGQPGSQAPPSAASSRYSPGAGISPPSRRNNAAAAATAGGAGGGDGGGGGAAAAAASAQNVWFAAAPDALGGTGTGYGGVVRAASHNVALSSGGVVLGASGLRGYVPQRMAPSRPPSRQHMGFMDSTGLSLLGQNLITIGSSSGGPNNFILSSLHSPNVSGKNAVSGVNALGPERFGSVAVAAAPGMVLSGELIDDGVDADPSGAVSSLEPVRGLRSDLRADSCGSPFATSPLSSRTVALLLAGAGVSQASKVAVRAVSPKSTHEIGSPTAAAREAPSSAENHGGDITADAAGAPTKSMTPKMRLSAPQILVSPLLWRIPHQEEQQQQQHEFPTSHMGPVGPSPEPLAHAQGRSDTETHHGGSLSFRRHFHGGSLPQSSITAGGSPGAAADAASIRNKMRVSWSDMEVRASGGSTGTNTLLTTASEVSKTSTAGTDPTAPVAAVSDILTARWAHTGRRSGSEGTAAEAPVPLAPAPTPAGTARADGESLAEARPGGHAPPQTSDFSPSLSPEATSFTEAGSSWVQQQARTPPASPHLARPKDQPLQYDAYLVPQQSVGSAITVASGQSNMPGIVYRDGLRGSGEPSDSLMAVEMENMRVARELAAMWTTSSMGETSSQVGPSTHSSVVAGAPSPQAAAAFAVSVFGPRPGPPAVAPYDGAPRSLSAVAEISGETPVIPPEVSEHFGNTRQRRLSQVINPGQPARLPRARDLSAGPQQLQVRLRDMNAHPSLALTGTGLMDSASAQSSGASGIVLSGPSAAASMVVQMSAVTAGGSVSSLAGGASTAMSFDNWATADDLAAVLLGPAGPGGNGATGGPELAAPYSPVWSSSSWRSAPLQPSRLAAPSLPSQNQTCGPDKVSQQLQVAQAPRVPLRTLSWLGPRYAKSFHGDTAGSGGGIIASAGASDCNNRADYVLTAMDHIGGASCSGSVSASMRRGVLGSAAGNGGPRHLTLSRLPSVGLNSNTSQLQSSVAWFGPDRGMPSRSPSVPNMGRSGARGLHRGSLRRTSSMGKSRLGSMSFVSSGNVGLMNTTNTVPSGSLTPGTVPSAGNVHPATASAASGASAASAAGTPAVAGHSHAVGRDNIMRLALCGGKMDEVSDSGLAPGRSISASVSGWEGDPMDSYAHLLPMRASQTQLALSLPASSLRGSVVGGARSGGNGIACSLAAAGATVSGPVGWARDATQLTAVHRAPFRRSSLDERLLKQVMTARLMNMPHNLALTSRNSGRQRSAVSPASLGYTPSRLSLDGKVARGPAPRASELMAAAVSPSAPSGPASAGRCQGRQDPHLVPQSGPLSHQRSLGAIPELHAKGWSGDIRVPNLGMGATSIGNARVGHTATAPLENHRSSVAGSIATAVTASSTSLQSFADVALGGANYG